MTEDRLNELLDDAKRTWLEPPEPDYQAMWGRIERDAFGGGGARKVSRAPSWRIYSIGLAATLVMGVALGRFSMKQNAPETVAAVQADSAIESPAGAYDKAATELLGRTVVLLTSLPSAHGVGGGERFSRQATELLTSTRLLLDSPAASDVRFKNLLEDLELVLAQIAMLQSGRTRQEIDLITDALEERDVVPRIRSAVARLSTGD
jgi:hypothetical protein